MSLARLRRVPVLPTLFTAGNLACGVTAILAAAHDLLGLGAGLVFVAMVCDLLDGKVARLTGTDGAFGAQLDSLADIVSFGVAPALLLHRLVLGKPGVWAEGERLVWLVTILYAVFTAIRLARHNVEHQTGPTRSFRGLPSPGAAAVLCSWIGLWAWLTAGGEPAWADHTLSAWVGLEELRHLFALGLMALGLLCAVLMVSTVPFPHLGNTLLAGEMSFRRLVLVILLLGLLLLLDLWALPLVATGYVIVGLGPGLTTVVRRWLAGRQVLDDEDELT